MLLIIEALLLISAALVKDHRAAADGILLNMQEDSVDDNFMNCENIMLGNLHQLKANNRFMEAWKNDAEESKREKCEHPASESNQQAAGSKQKVLTPDESKAIRIWTGKNKDLYGDFNKAVRSGKQNYIDSKYEWYKLHFLLTSAIRKLKNIQTKCVKTYRRTHSTFVKENVKNKEIRFGSFASSSFDQNVIKGFGKESCFEITTCYGAELSKYSLHPKMCEVLIPPYEKFKVIEIKEKTDKNNLWCDTVYKLESSGVRSDLSCAIVNIINSGKKHNFFKT